MIDDEATDATPHMRGTALSSGCALLNMCNTTSILGASRGLLGHLVVFEVQAWQ